MIKKNTFLLFVFLFLVVSICDSAASQSKSLSKVDKSSVRTERDSSPIETCESYDSLKNFECLSNQLEGLDNNIAKLIQELKSGVHSEWGPKADEEVSKRLDLSQSSWNSYRDSFCNFDYYSNAASHPPSQSERVLRCKVSKTKQRIIEIQELFKK